MKLYILTPEASVFEGEAESIVVPGAYGLFGVLNNHAPILSSISPGPLKYKQNENEITHHISGGFIEFNSNQANILADSIEDPNEIDINRVDQAIKRAKKRLKDRKNIDAERARRSLLRGLSRHKIYASSH